MIRFIIVHEGIMAQLPVNPESLEIRIPGNNASFEVVSLGEIRLLKKQKLAQVKIKSFFPATPHGSYVLTTGRFEEPQFYIDFIERVRNSPIPAHVIVTDLDMDTDIAIDDFTYSYNHGTDDVDFELTIRQYRPYTAKVMRVVSPAPETVVSNDVEVAVNTSNRQKRGFAIGDTVNVTGTYHSSSYGDGPSGRFKQPTGKISHIVADTTRAYRYHITTTSGGYLGWVSENQISMT